jgi:hypothetical protein
LLFPVANPFGFKSVCILAFPPFHCRQTHSSLWVRPSALHRLQLLQPTAATRVRFDPKISIQILLEEPRDGAYAQRSESARGKQA